MNYWMVKQEPAEYSFDALLREGATEWTGVRNFQARNNLRAMRQGDRVLFYHSVTEKAVVGLAEVSREAFQDGADKTGDWVAVELVPVEKFRKPVNLGEIKAHKNLQNIALVKQSRLSVIPLSEVEFDTILKMGS